MTSHLTCTNTASGSIRYGLSPKKQDGDYEQGERLKYIYSTLTAEPKIENLKIMTDEFELHRGHKYDCVNLRLACSRKLDRLPTEQEFQAIVKDAVKQILGNRPFIAVLHDDAIGQWHIHISAVFLEPTTGQALKFFSKNKAEKFCEDRQRKVNAICQGHGLSILEMPQTGYRHKEINDRDTRTIKAMRCRFENNPEQATTLWLDELRKDFKDAIKTEKTVDGIFQRLAEKGWTVSRETDKHITLTNGICKCRLARLNKNLPNRQSLQNFLDGNNSSKPIQDIGQGKITPCASNVKAIKPTGSAGTGNVTALQTDTEDVKQAINIYNKEMAKMQAMAGQVAEVETEIDNVLKIPNLHAIINYRFIKMPKRKIE